MSAGATEAGASALHRPAPGMPMRMALLRRPWTRAASMLVLFAAAGTAWSVATNDVITPLTAALAGLGLSQAAYTAEVIRAGILSVPPGQTRAAKTLGLGPSVVFGRVVFPQAMRVVIPPLGNEVFSMVMGTSLVSVIAMADLLHTAQLIYARTYETIPLLIVASLWCLAIVSVLSVAQHALERHYGRGT